MALPQGSLGEEHERTRRVDGPAGEGGQSSQTIRQRCPQPARSPSQGTSPDCYSFQLTTKILNHVSYLRWFSLKICALIKCTLHFLSR